MKDEHRLVRLKTTLWAIVGVLAVVTILRFARGLGATTNLSDSTPWGLWIGLDVMTGVALAAGGFVLAGAVYVFGLERYRPFLRAAVLTAFLGYLAVAAGLLYDLGLPWHIWHPMIFWQHRSVLFEVAMCVMLYLTVLALEFAPVILEHPRFDRPLLQKIRLVLCRWVVPLVIAGIILSTLHQSSLGSLFLIAPYRLHPLWYSPILWILFFVSAAGLGLMMVTLESLLSARAFGHRIRTDLLSGLGLAAAVVLLAYLGLRLGDLAVRGVLASAFDGSWQGTVFLTEILVSALLPAGFLLVGPVRRSVPGLAFCSALTVAGMTWYRIDVAIVAMARPEGASYFPTWIEFAVSLGLLSLLILVFIFFAEHFRVFEEEGGEERRPRTEVIPGEALAGIRGPRPDPVAAPRRYSLAAIVGAAVAVVLLPPEAVLGKQPRETPVLGARTVLGVVDTGAEGPGARLRFADDGGSGRREGPVAAAPLPERSKSGDPPVPFDHEEHVARLGREESCGVCHPPSKDALAGGSECRFPLFQKTDSKPPGGSERTLLMLIDGNRNGTAVLFDHDGHARKLGGEEWCGTCHHLNRPLDHDTSCWECHGDMFSPVPVFDHAHHIRRLGGNGSCDRCHDDPAAPRGLEGSRACVECHSRDAHLKLLEIVEVCTECHEDTLVPQVVFKIKAGSDRWLEAPSYLDAMHGTCIKCHEKIAKSLPDLVPASLSRCDTCHDADRVETLRRMVGGRGVVEEPGGAREERSSATDHPGAGRTGRRDGSR